MSMNDNDSQYTEMGIRNFIYDQNIPSYYILYTTIRIIRSHYYVLTMNDSNWVPPLGITGVWSDVDHLAAHPRAESRILPLAHTIGRGRPPPVLRTG